ncbi:hypothetical protein [Neobacillus novalis]|uniref:hypothetical protein n=1 Tax=Neobacillus novalis TaxID=220687 RepID=UPI0012E777F6|nr:hypothetical protein [Neobacillus novalis]
MSCSQFGYMEAYLNKGVSNNSVNFHIMYVLHATPGGFRSHVSTGQTPSHSFVIPIQVVDAGLSNGTGQSPYA